MIKFKPKVAASPQRKAAEQLLDDLRRTLEMEAGRGNITVNHFLSVRGSQAREDFMPQNRPGTGFYKLEEVVATGGMGAVLKAFDTNLARTVALKVMLSNVAVSEEAIFRFVAEAQITGQLEHPNIVPLHDIGVAADGTIYYTMKLIQGRTLRDILHEIRAGKEDTIQRYSITKLLEVFQKVCDGMGYAHSRRVVHRDLKPDNVMIGEFGEVLILDWGLAKVLPEPGQADAEGAEGSEFSGPLGDAAAGGEFATMAGQIKGTPNYMAPEQAEGRVADIDTRSDIYALGAILYSILTLRPPVTGANLDEILTKVTSGDIQAPSTYNSGPIENPAGSVAPHCPNGLIPAALSAVAMKAMSRASADRYQFVEALQGDIGAYQRGYATSAQEANIFTLIKLLLQRNKKEAFMAIGALVLMVLTGVAFLGKVKFSEMEAQKALKGAGETLSTLRATAPSFYAVAESKIQERNFPEALTNIDRAINLIGTNAQFHYLKGNIYQSMLQIQEARDAYEKAREYNPTHRNARENSELCAAILSNERGKGSIGAESIKRLYERMSDQGRTTEALAMSGRLGKGDQTLFDSFRAALKKAGIKGQLQRDGGNQFHLDLRGESISSLQALRGIPLSSLSLSNCVDIADLTALAGMPLTRLDLSGTRVNDLSPIKGMGITELSLAGCPELTDLLPVAGMPLVSLNLRGTRILDISAVKGMLTLNWLDLSGTQIRDIAPLAGVPLTWLNLDQTKVLTLASLKGAPLNYLSFNETNVRDIIPLAGMPLTEELSMNRTLVRELGPLKGMRLQVLKAFKAPVSDLTPLANMPLKFLDLRESGVTQLAALAGIPLDVLRLAGTAVSDIGPLRGAPLTIELDLSGTKVTSLEPLRGAPLQYINLSKTPVTSVAPLSNMPLIVLRLDGCPTQPDLNPLWDCQDLEQLSLPFPSPTVIALRQLPKLKRLTYNVPLDDWNRASSPAAFWKDWDARLRK